LEYWSNRLVDGRDAKDALYEQFARIGKAMASPRRLELLELLGQGERSVDGLAQTAGLGVTTTSSHLQVLKAVGLVATRRRGTTVLYRLSGDDVSAMVMALRDVAQTRLAEVRDVVATYFAERDTLEPISSADLLKDARRDGVVLIDVRPRSEFEAGHIPGAISMPMDELPGRMQELPTGADVVAYCRGPYCVLAPQAVALLTEHGYRARRLDGGLPEWRVTGNPVEVGV
jgi:rhodanese-related sulfurtransferase/DNA-binding transcriptional ArsR family regulator